MNPQARKEHTIRVRITVGSLRKKFLAAPDYVLVQHHAHQPEVHATSSKTESEILHDHIKEMEDSIAKKTKTALATSLRIIANLEETVRVHKIRIADLEKANELLLGKPARIPLPAPPKNPGTDKNGD
jgi:hypothetical protein